MFALNGVAVAVATATLGSEKGEAGRDETVMGLGGGAGVRADGCWIGTAQFHELWWTPVRGLSSGDPSISSLLSVSLSSFSCNSVSPRNDCREDASDSVVLLLILLRLLSGSAVWT
jgi:hypothetical protein